jgi:hypothetical protein
MAGRTVWACRILRIPPTHRQRPHPVVEEPFFDLAPKLRAWERAVNGEAPLRGEGRAKHAPNHSSLIFPESSTQARRTGPIPDSPGRPIRAWPRPTCGRLRKDGSNILAARPATAGLKCQRTLIETGVVHTKARRPQRWIRPNRSGSDQFDAGFRQWMPPAWLIFLS